MLKKENGVTLVALVITIIVLLILAGVALSMVMGDSGIFGKANKASLATNIADAKDAVNMAIMEATANQYDDNGQLATDETAAAGKNFLVTSTNSTDAVNLFLNEYNINAGVIYKGKDQTTPVKDANGDSLTVSLTVDATKHSVTPTYTNDKLEADAE